MLGTRLLPRQPPSERAEAQLPTPSGAPSPVARLVFPPPARLDRRESSHRPVSLRILSFLAVVIVPLAIAAVYYLAVAADQYVTEFRMTLRRADAPQIEPALFFGTDVVHGTAAAESQIVAQYIASRAIVDELDPSLGLRALFSTQGADWWARLPLPASIEELYRPD
jgi:capsular polysaccharide transport system permease protein